MTTAIEAFAAQIDRALVWALPPGEVVTVRTLFDRVACTVGRIPATDDQLRRWTGMEPDDLVYADGPRVGLGTCGAKG